MEELVHHRSREMALNARDHEAWLNLPAYEKELLYANMICFSAWPIPDEVISDDLAPTQSFITVLKVCQDGNVPPSSQDY